LFILHVEKGSSYNTIPFIFIYTPVKTIFHTYKSGELVFYISSNLTYAVISLFVFKLE
jgi:hypothetical protein